jgi:hypothetical protein
VKNMAIRAAAVHQRRTVGLRSYANRGGAKADIGGGPLRVKGGICGKFRRSPVFRALLTLPTSCASMESRPEPLKALPSSWQPRFFGSPGRPGIPLAETQNARNSGS